MRRREASTGDAEFAGKHRDSLSEAIKEALGPSELLVCRVVVKIVEHALGEERVQDCLREEQTRQDRVVTGQVRANTPSRQRCCTICFCSVHGRADR